VETRLYSESFQPLIGFLAFLVQKLWPKSHKFGKKSIFTFIPNFDQFLVFLTKTVGNHIATNIENGHSTLFYAESPNTLLLTLHAVLTYMSLHVLVFELSFIKLLVAFRKSLN